MTSQESRPGRAFAFLVGLAGVLPGCGPGPGPAPQVEYARCWAVDLPGPVCVLYPDRQLKLWVEADPRDSVEIEAGGERLPATGEEVGGGRRYLLEAPPAATTLNIRLHRPDGRASAAWSLALAEPEAPAWFGEIQGLLAAGKTDEARRVLAPLRESAPARQQGLVLQLLALAALSAGDKEGALAHFESAKAADHARHRLSGEARNAALLARLQLENGRFREARQNLGGLLLTEPAPADAKVLAAYYEGLLADQVGDSRRALQQLREAADLADRTGLLHYRWQTELTLARLLRDLGRSQSAEEIFVRLAANPHFETPCDRGVLLQNWSWSRLIGREGGEEAMDPTAMLEEALAFFDRNSCARPEQRLNARLNLALAQQQAGRWREARRLLAEALPLADHATLRQRLWWQDLDGRAAIAEGQPARALRLYQALQEIAEQSLSREGSFRACFGRARAELARGRRGAALATLVEADRLSEEQVWQIPLHEGRDTFLAMREAATRLHLELLLAAGRHEQAFALARRSRSRLLRQLMVRDRLAQLTAGEQEEWDRALSDYQALRAEIDREAAAAWQLPKDQVRRAGEGRAAQLAGALAELDRAVAGLGDLAPGGEGALAPPRPGELILAYHPLPGGWVGFAAHPGAVEVHRFELSREELAHPAALALRLLEPFRSAIAQAERLRVLAYGDLRPIDFHALPFAGEPLLARLPVIFGLDLPTRSAAGREGPRIALLVTDPEGNLPAARQEAAQVAARIDGWGPAWDLRRLDRQAASAGALRAALPRAELFHYAGHGAFAGFAGWDSVLRLADSSRLTPADILILPQAPAWAVLSACEAGRSSGEAPGEGIGLAQAFLLAGTRAVVAATRPVTDRAARDLLGELYRDWKPGEDLAQALRAAQLACRRQDPAADWASFRLLEP